MPHMGELASPAAMEMHAKHITLNQATCEELAVFLPPAMIIEGLLDHGVSHYTRCPWDLVTHLQLYAIAKDELQRKSLAKLATDTFIDVVANTSCVKDVPTAIPQVYQYLNGGPLHQALTALYAEIWGMDLPGEADPTLVRRLARIPYLDRQQWQQSLRRFVQLLRPLFEEEGRQRAPDPPALGHYGLESYSREEVAQGLQAFAQQAEDSSQFRETVRDFAEDLVALGYGMDAAIGAGQGQQIDADVLYYMQLAQNYRLPLRGLPMERSGTLEPYSHIPWEASQPIHDLDIWTSFGKILPGLSQTWKRRQGKVYGQREGTPDCIIALDSSGSMPNPRQKLSEAVLGAACAAEAYLRREARIAVYNFSDAIMGGKTVVPFTTDRQALYTGLCVYHGGGTSLRFQDLDALRRTAGKGKVDLLLITDMQLANLEETMEYLGGVNGRMTIVHIGENPSTQHFRQALSRHPHLDIFTVHDIQDIPRIVLGQVHHYFRLQASP